MILGNKYVLWFYSLSEPFFGNSDMSAFDYVTNGTCRTSNKDLAN